MSGSLEVRPQPSLPYYRATDGEFRTSSLKRFLWFSLTRSRVVAISSLSRINLHMCQRCATHSTPLECGKMVPNSQLLSTPCWSFFGIPYFQCCLACALVYTRSDRFFLPMSSLNELLPTVSNLRAFREEILVYDHNLSLNAHKFGLHHCLHE